MQTSPNAPGYFELTGSLVEGPTVIINSLAIRDTAYYYSSPVKGNGFPYRTIRVYNSLDQAIEVSFEVSRDEGITWQYGAQLAASQATGITSIYGRTSGGNALAAPWPDWRIRVKASVAPTSGSIEAWHIQHAN